MIKMDFSRTKTETFFFVEQKAMNTRILSSPLFKGSLERLFFSKTSLKWTSLLSSYAHVLFILSSILVWTWKLKGIQETIIDSLFHFKSEL